MDQLNRMRMMAGISVRSNPKAKEPIQKQITENYSGEYWIVINPLTEHATLHDVASLTDTKGLVQQIFKMGDPQKAKDLYNITVYSGDQKDEALKDARSRLEQGISEAIEDKPSRRKMKELDKKNNGGVCPKCEIDPCKCDSEDKQDLDEAKAKKPDADGDGVPDWADKKPGKDDKKKSKKKSKKKLDENITTIVGPLTHHDSKDAINTVGTELYTRVVDDDSQANIEPGPHGIPNRKKDDTEGVTVPANIKSALRTQIAALRKSAESSSGRGRDEATAQFHEASAAAMEDILHYLDRGSVEGLQLAQVHMIKLMGPIIQLIPDEVYDFVTRGGRSRSLKDFYKEVKLS